MIEEQQRRIKELKKENEETSTELTMKNEALEKKTVKLQRSLLEVMTRLEKLESNSTKLN